MKEFGNVNVHENLQFLVVIMLYADLVSRGTPLIITPKGKLFNMYVHMEVS